MTKRDWLATGLRVAGVTMIVITVLEAAGLLIQIAEYLGRNRDVQLATFIVLALSFTAIIAAWAAVVKWADLIARKIAPEEPPTGNCESPEGQKAVLVLSMRVMGAVVLINLVGTIIQTVNSWQNPTTFRVAEASGTTVAGWMVASIVAWSMLIGLSVYLLFGRKWLLWLAFPPEKAADQGAWGGEQIPVFGSARNLFSVALRVIGLCFLLKQPVGLAYGLVIQAFPPAAEAMGRAFNWERFIESWLLLIVGVYFLTGGKRLVQLLFRERRATGNASDETAGGKAGS
jgi:hypothetical protein